MKRAAIPKLVRSYNPKLDEDAQSAGYSIQVGEFSRANLNTIYEWKTRGRGRSRLLQNSDREIEDALHLAAVSQEPRSAIAVLTGLYGINVPAASAVAAMIHPNLHTVLDFRALHALGNQTADRTIPFYLSYRAYCAGLAERWSVSLRTLDQALWQWSKENSEGLGAVSGEA